MYMNFYLSTINEEQKIIIIFIINIILFSQNSIK